MSDIDKELLDLSVVLITLNEEERLRKCLESLPRGAEIIVVDSASQDRTVELAKSFGARCFQRKFDHFSNQKNYGIDQASRGWILCLDADERLDTELRQSILKVISHAEEKAAYRLKRRLIFLGSLLKFGKTQDRPIRFFPSGYASYTGSVHEVLSCDGRPISLSGTLYHESYKGLSDYLEKFNRYTTLVAAQKPPQSRLAFLKHLLRPWFEFFSRYVLRLGFLDGYPGYCYALLSSFYAFTKYAKCFERERGAYAEKP